jgi:hypothetical protein
MHSYKVITLPMTEDDMQDQTDYIVFDVKSPETAVNMARGFRKTINRAEYRTKRKDDHVRSAFLFFIPLI